MSLVCCMAARKYRKNHARSLYWITKHDSTCMLTVYISESQQMLLQTLIINYDWDDSRGTADKVLNLCAM